MTGGFKSASEILSEMGDYLAAVASPLTDLNIGGATRTFMEAVALVLAEFHYLSEQLLSRFWVSTATGTFLDQRASEYGLYRVQASPTIRSLSVSHAAGAAVTIPVGWTCGTLPGAATQVTYQCTQQVVLPIGPASVGVLVVSTTAGVATAIPDGTDLRQQGAALAGIDAITTGAVVTPGTDRESDDSLRARVLDKLRNPPGPGSAADYERAVLDAFAGTVESVTVIPLWNGPGSVEVLILGPGNAIPSSGVIDEVQAYLDTWAPIGAAVTVAAPVVVVVDVEETVTPGAGFDWGEVEANVREAVAVYLDGLGLGETSKLAAIGDATWRTAGVGGPSGHDGGNYAALEQRAVGNPFAAADVVVNPSSKVMAGTITLTEGP